MNRKNGANTDRNQKGRFAPGNRGKQQGAKHRATTLALELLEAGIEDVAGVVVEAERSGDLTAARIVESEHESEDRAPRPQRRGTRTSYEPRW